MSGEVRSRVSRDINFYFNFRCYLLKEMFNPEMSGFTRSVHYSTEGREFIPLSIPSYV